MRHPLDEARDAEYALQNWRKADPERQELIVREGQARATLTLAAAIVHAAKLIAEKE